MDDGVAPVAVTSAETVPVIDVFPTAVASLTMSGGTVTCAWKPVRLNCWPADGDAGDRLPVSTTSLKARSPMGELVQKSSNGAVAA